MVGLDYSIEIFLMLYLSIRMTLTDQIRGARVIYHSFCAQVYFTGWQSLPLVGVLAVVTGILITVNMGPQSILFTNQGVLTKLIYVIAIRELGPLIVGFVVIARSGSAVASELGNMRANKETLALRSMGIDPYSYLVFPRVIAGVLSVLCLSFYFNFFAISSGYLMGMFLYRIPLELYSEAMVQHFSFYETIWIIGKVLVISMTIFLVSCFQGLRVRSSFHEVPQATTKAVVISMTAVTVISFLSAILWSFKDNIWAFYFESF